MTATLVDQPALRLAAVRHVGPYEGIGAAFQRLSAVAGAAGLFAGPVLMIGVYHNSPEVTAPEALQSDAGIIVGPDTPIPAGLTEVRLPAGRYAMVRHIGPYTGLGAAWSELREWFPRSGRRPGTGTGYEIYRNSPMTAAAADLITDVYLPAG